MGCITDGALGHWSCRLTLTVNNKFEIFNNLLERYFTNLVKGQSEQSESSILTIYYQIHYMSRLILLMKLLFLTKYLLQCSQSRLSFSIKIRFWRIFQYL